MRSPLRMTSANQPLHHATLVLPIADSICDVGLLTLAVHMQLVASKKVLTEAAKVALFFLTP